MIDQNKLKRELEFVEMRIKNLMERRNGILEKLSKVKCIEDLSPEAIERNQKLAEELKEELK